MTLELEEARDRVQLGVAWLDEHAPGWRDRVEINELNMESTCRCVLGQVFRHEAPKRWSDRAYWWVVQQFPGGRELLTLDESIKLGFDGDGLRDFPVLKEAWQEELARGA